MKLTSHLLLTVFFLMFSRVASSQSSGGDLPVFDLNKQYPKKEKVLQEIADIEYVALETTDDVLLSGRPILSAVTDHYILIHEETLGDVYVFDRSGKIYSHFNHKGPSALEYGWIGSAGTILDEKQKEIYVCARSIQVYSLTGEYKRTLPLNTLDKELKVYNFDDESLLLYNGVIAGVGMKNKYKKNPYSLISKKDGSELSVVDIYLPERYSNMIVKKENNRERSTMIYYTYNMYYGPDFMIGDMSSDTLYLLTQNKKLTPVLTRKPSVHAAEPRIIWAPRLTTDKFIQIGLIPLDFNSRGGKTPVFTYEFETGEISRMTILDPEYGRGKWYPSTSPAMAKNSIAELYQASSLVEMLKNYKLKGDFEKFVRKIDENDNPVIRIIKFK